MGEPVISLDPAAVRDVVLAVLGAGWLSTLVGAIIERRKRTADAKKTDGEFSAVVVDTTKKLIEQLNARIDGQEEELQKLREQLEVVKAERDRLAARVSELEKRLS